MFESLEGREVPQARLRWPGQLPKGGNTEGSSISLNVAFAWLSQLYRHGRGQTKHYVCSEFPTTGGVIDRFIGWYFAMLFVLQKWTVLVCECMTKNGGTFAQ